MHEDERARPWPRRSPPTGTGVGGARYRPLRTLEELLDDLLGGHG